MTQPIETAREPDYCFDPGNWECTYDWNDWNLMMEGADGVVEIATLYKGPRKWAAKAVEGDKADMAVWKLFDTKEEADAANTAFWAWLAS
jgi:hypothetical protein